MPAYTITRTVELVWHVEAPSVRDAAAIACTLAERDSDYGCDGSVVIKTEGGKRGTRFTQDEQELEHVRLWG